MMYEGSKRVNPCCLKLFSNSKMKNCPKRTRKKHCSYKIAHTHKMSCLWVIRQHIYPRASLYVTTADDIVAVHAVVSLSGLTRISTRNIDLSCCPFPSDNEITSLHFIRFGGRSTFWRNFNTAKCKQRHDETFLNEINSSFFWSIKCLSRLRRLRVSELKMYEG